MTGSPFNLSDRSAYLAWREKKLAAQPATVMGLAVEVGDITRLSPNEHGALMDRVRCSNMAVYVETPKPGRDDKAALRTLAAAFGLDRLDGNTLADSDAVTPLTVHHSGTRSRYIPFTDRPIAWHTDGYYNPPERTVRALLLHCAQPAAEGGENRLLDHEILYILLRDHDPLLVRALMRPDAMTIPPNEEEGMERSATVGPVFAVEPSGRLHMRYTARGRNVVWSPEPDVQAAAALMRSLMDEPSGFVFRHRLEAGQGLISNNVLHTREPFRDDPASPRLLYRVRTHDRIAGS